MSKKTEVVTKLVFYGSDQQTFIMMSQTTLSVITGLGLFLNT